MKKAMKRILLALVSLLGVAVLVVGSYVGYVYVSYDRLEDDLALEIERGATLIRAERDQEYTIATYNIGFGAYSQDYTFFMDEGIELDGTRTSGAYSTSRSVEEFMFNTEGAVSAIAEIAPDFAFFQEVDTDSTRSHHLNQHAMIRAALPQYDATHAVNFHSAFLAYPLTDMHGKSNAGITTLSKISINEAIRKRFTVSDSFAKFFDLDRCFSVQKAEVNGGGDLYLINVHMSAYDEGGVIRRAQREELNRCIEDLYQTGAYVIVGGDFNHDLLTYHPSYGYDGDNRPFSEYIGQRKPDWLQYFFEEDGTTLLPDAFRVVASDNAPTCRDADIPWEYGHTYVSTIDGFIVSDNVEVLSAETVVTASGNLGTDHFAYSDHDPVKMVFRLK